MRFALRDVLTFSGGATAAAAIVAAMQFSPRSHLLPTADLPSFFKEIPDAGVLLPIVIAAIMALAAVAFLATASWPKVSAAIADPFAKRERRQNSAPVDRAEVETARNELDKQLGRLILLIAGQVQKSDQRQAKLDDANRQLSEINTAEELRRLVETLMSDNSASRDDASTLEARLKEAQAEASSLRVRLFKAEKLAMTDPLTEVANRRHLQDQLAFEIDQAHEKGLPLCLAITDIDHFKRVNDTYGHAAGDKALQKFAELLTKSVRSKDLVARMGGEEFAIVLPGTPMGSAFTVAERIRLTLQEVSLCTDANGVEIGKVTASFGVAEIKDGEDATALIARADEKLYEAKNKGRNRTVIWGSAA